MARKINLELYHSEVKERYENGDPVDTIAKDLHIGNSALYKIIDSLKLPRRRTRARVETEKTVGKLMYANNSVKLEKVVIYGKRYTDITPLFSPR